MVLNGSVDRRASSLYTLGKKQVTINHIERTKECLMFCSNSSVTRGLTVTSIWSNVLLKI